MLVGQITSDPGRPATVLMWHEGSRTVRVQATISLDVLLSAVAGSRPASAEEWQSLMAAPPPSPGGGQTVDAVVHAARIGSTLTRAGSIWTVQLSDDPTLTANGQPSDATIDVVEIAPTADEARPAAGRLYPLVLDPASPLVHFESLDATVLVVALRGPTDAAFMRVTVGDIRSNKIPLINISGTDLFGAAYAYSEAQPFAVNLLDADGTVIQPITG